MTIYAYIRVSTGKQTAENQLNTIGGRLGVGVSFEIVKEVESGGKHLKNLHALVETMKENDTLIVCALDRLGRKLRNVLEIMETLLAKKITLISIREGVDFSTPVGRLVGNIMGSVAEMEKEMISERTKQAMQTKKKDGYLICRPWKYDENMRLRIWALRRQGCTLREIQEITGVSNGGIRYILDSEKRDHDQGKRSEKRAQMKALKEGNAA